jgi:PAS domain-containing protein
MLEEAMDGFLMVIASDGVILYASENMESFVALSPRDVIGHSLHDFVQSEQDSKTITKNLEPKGDKPSQYRTFFLELRNSASPKSPLCGNKMLLRLSGHLKVSVDHPPCSNQKSSSEPSLVMTSSSSEEETGPHVLGLVAECRPMALSLSILEMEFPDLSFTCVLGLDHMMRSIDDRIRNILGFEPEYFIAFSYKDFMHPGDTEMMEQAHEFLARTGYVCKPPYRVMSASGDWVWIKAEAVLRYNKKTKKPTHYDMLCKVVGQTEGTVRYIEQKQLSGWPQGMFGQHAISVPDSNWSCVQMVHSPSSTPSPSCSVSTNSTFSSPTPSPSSSVAVPAHPQSHSMEPNPPIISSVQHQMLDMPLSNFSTPQQQHPPPPPPPPPSQEWVERQRQLEDQIQRQKELLQDLIVQQEVHQMMMPEPQEMAAVQQTDKEPTQNHFSPLSSGYSSSLSSLAPSPLSSTNSGHKEEMACLDNAPSPLELSSVKTRSLSSLAPFPLSHVGLSTVPATQPLPLPQMANGGQNGPNTTTGDATNVSFLGSVDFLSSGSPDSALPLSPDIQELLQQFM